MLFRSLEDIPIDTRIIATVNEPPQTLMENGLLRKDFYYRLNVVNITIPPLRERLSDIPLLAQAIVEKENREFGKEIWMVSEDAIETFKSYDYSGNVRELENIIAQAVSLTTNEHVLTSGLLQMPVSTGVFSSNTTQIGRASCRERV